MTKTILTYLWDRRTTVLGYLQITLSIMAASTELFGDRTILWLMLGNSILTAILGHYNNSLGVRASPVDKQGGFARTGLLVTLLGAVSLLILAGCAGLGFVAPKSFSERLASGYTTVTTIRLTTNTLLNGKVISSTDAQNLQEQADVAREGLDVARSLQGIDAENRLEATLKILDAAQGYLCAKAPTHPNCATR